jgi:TonB-dependent receptor
MGMHGHSGRGYRRILLLGLTGWGCQIATAADSPAGPTPAGADSPPQQLEEVVVTTGLRESLGKSLELKQSSEIVLDSINALELGRFPDDDVADSLRHITGVQITRTTGGDGQYVGIRGLGQQYNIVTLNNRIVATDDDGRALAFDILPADVISGADVLKSSQASALEGSIGGTVNMRSAHPFDNPGLHTAVRVEGNYNDMSEYYGKKASAFVSDTTSDRQFGALLGVVFADQKTRTDSVDYNTYDPNNPGVWPLDGSQPVVAQCCISFGSVVDEKKRTSVSGAFEWRPTDTLHLTVDGLYSRLNDPQVQYSQAYYPAFNYDANGNPEWSNVVVTNGLITSFDANTFTPEVVNHTINRQVTTSLFGLNGSWQATSNFSLAADVYRSKANRPEGGTDAFVTAGLESSTPYNQNTISWHNNAGGLPSISVTLPDGSDYATALASGALDNNHWSAHYTGLNGNSIHDEVTGATLDGKLKMENAGPLVELRFGLAQTWRKKERADIDNDWTGGSSQYDFYTTPDGANPITFGSLGANVISTTTFPNYMQHSGGVFPHTIAVFNVQSLLNALKSLDGQPNLYVPGAPNFDFAATLPQFNAVNSYKVREDTTAGYFEAAFAGEQWSGNAGLRVVHTRTSASTAVNEIQTVTIANTSNPTDPAFVQYSDATPTTSTGSYTEVLPSLNFMYRIRHDMQMRFGASETITRPLLSQLAPTRTDDSLNRDYRVSYSGNSELKPIKAYGADLSFEWYYQPKSALTLAVFGKYIKDFITDQVLLNQDIGVQGFFNGSTTPVPVLYSIVQPINGDKGYVEGVEFGFQHLLDNGFGIHGQYTRTFSKAYVAGVNVGQLEGVSPSSGSAGVLYEKGRISANINWDYDGGYVKQTSTEVPDLKAYQRSFSWVTAQVSYELLEGLKLYFEGKNLTNAIARTYLGNRSDAVWAFGSPSAGTGSDADEGYAAYGRSYTLGASYRF